MDKTKYLQRWSALKTERSSWDEHWRDIAGVLMPRAPRFLTTDRNRGEKRHQAINDSTMIRAHRTLGAGMLSGASSPARPWFRAGIADLDLMDYQPVKLWLNDLTMLLQRVFRKSNTYAMLHSSYLQQGAFGTSASIVTENFDTVIHHNILSIGEFAIATDHLGRPNTIYRDFEMTVGELVGEFGAAAVSARSRAAYDSHKLDQPVVVLHCIEPRKERDMRNKSAKHKPFKSIYFELGAEDNKVLRESGFDRFPALCPRWWAHSNDIYGESPAMDILGHIKQLQVEQLRKSQGIDYMTKPPLQVPTALKNMPVNGLPGGVTYVDVTNPNAGIRPAWETRIDLSHLLNDIYDVRQQIKEGFFTDLFLMLQNSVDQRKTATEVAELHEEKLTMLGPVLENQHNDTFEPLIDISFDKILKAGALPPPPEELAGQEIEIEFVSMLAQAQRAINTNSIDRFVANLGAVAQFKPEVLDKFDQDEWADAYSDMLGVDPQLIVASDKVAIVRQNRAQAQAQAAQAEQEAMAAKTARDMASADTSGKNALTDAAQMFSGYGGV